MFKDKQKPPSLVQDLCKKLKSQLEQLNVEREQEPPRAELKRHKELFENLSKQIAELSR